MSMQCTRRFIETNFLQIFSKKSKINLIHYIWGYLHYYGIVVLIVAKADGFITGQLSKPSTSYNFTNILLVTSTSILFLFFWYKQYETNMIFINLRKVSDGKVKTESHLLPQGGWFNYVSSPHMLTEIAMYLTLYALLHENTSYIYCLSWVLSNQICNALLTHKWYLETFKDYPKERKAIIPFIL
jgi:3-oxo-5-alpha-steroid 4-dehydrogenase 3 / polyprenol reductase